jgi:hypothetical protein
MTTTRTHTKTFTQLSSWASTTPADYGDMPRPGSPCAVPRCGQPLKANEIIYAVTETGGPDAPEPIPCTSNPELTTADCGHGHQWVCWRHIRPDDGPIVATA